MKQYILHQLRNYFGLPLVLLSFINILLTYYRRDDPIDGYVVFVLKGLTDHYFIIYCFMPIFLLTILRNLQEESPSVLIRFKRFSHYFFSKCLAVVIYAVIFVSIQVLIILIIGSGLPLENTYVYTSGVEGELVEVFKAKYASPTLAVFSVLIFMIIGLGFIGISIMTIFHFFQRKVVITMILFSYVVMSLSIKISFLHWLPILGINRYVILHHNFLIANGTWLVAIEMGLLFLIQVTLVRWFWFKQLTLKIQVPKGMMFYYTRALWTTKNFIIMFLVLSSLVLYKSILSGEETTQDLFVRFFYGLEPGSVHLLTFIEHLIYSCTPLYLFSVFLEKWCSPTSFHLNSRAKKKKTILSSILLTGFLFHVVYVVLSYILLFIVGVASNKSVVGNTVLLSQGITSNDFLAFGLWKIGEFTVLFLLLFFVFLRTKNVTIAFLSILVLHVVNLLPSTIFLYNPVGFVSIARLGWRESVTTFSWLEVSLFLFIVIGLLFVLVNYSYKRYFD